MELRLSFSLGICWGRENWHSLLSPGTLCQLAFPFERVRCLLGHLSLGEVTGHVGRQGREARKMCSCNNLAVGILSHVHTSWEVDHKPVDGTER